MRFGLLFLLFFVSGGSIAQGMKWQYFADSANIFSSPRFTDLNEDGVKDVVLGGGVEDVAITHGVFAINGESGALLWKVPTSTQIYTSALFQDISGDGIDDVFIGGRAASYYALNGATGEIIWQFFEGSANESRRKGYLNFFGTQLVEDVDGDGYKDLLVTNGGDYLKAPSDEQRPTAQLMILSGATGEVINQVYMPEQRESYYAPHIYKYKNKEFVVFGTGGETVDGKLWQLSYKRLLKNSTKGAKVVAQDSVKGFILNSVLADITGDGHLDLMNAQMDGKLVAVNGKNKKTIWKHQFEGAECYVTPSLGYFNKDDVPDFFTIIAYGTFPQYSKFELIVIDGASGDILLQEEAGTNQFSPCVAADFNGDGIDEIVFVENVMNFGEDQQLSIGNQVRIYDIQNKKSSFVGEKRTGMSMASSPAIVDLDGDGRYELVVATSGLGMGKTTIERIDLESTFQQLSWPGYLGGKENGTLK